MGEDGVVCSLLKMRDGVDQRHPAVAAGTTTTLPTGKCYQGIYHNSQIITDSPRYSRKPRACWGCSNGTGAPLELQRNVLSTIRVQEYSREFNAWDCFCTLCLSSRFLGLLEKYQISEMCCIRTAFQQNFESKKKKSSLKESETELMKLSREGPR